MQAQSMIESYYIVVVREYPSGSYIALPKVYDDKEKADNAAIEQRKEGKFAGVVCRLSLPFIYDFNENKT